LLSSLKSAWLAVSIDGNGF